MKKQILAVLLAFLLCGCESLPAKTTDLYATQQKELTLAIPKGSTELLKEVARELSRRAEDFAEQSLTIEVVEQENIWAVLEDGTADLVVCENSQALLNAEKLGDLIYPFAEEKEEEEKTAPVLEGRAAMLAMLNYPYFFRNGDCVISGGNDYEVLAALNYSLSDDFGMELKRIGYCGVSYLLTNDWESLDAYLLEKEPGQLVQELQEQGEPLNNLWGRLQDSQINLWEIDLTESNTDLSNKTLLLGGERRNLLTIYANPEQLAELSAKEQAAVEEAIVYSGGYSRTLVEDQQESIMEQLKEQDIAMVELDLDLWYETFQKRYRSGNSEINSEFAELLWDKTERLP